MLDLCCGLAAQPPDTLPQWKVLQSVNESWWKGSLTSHYRSRNGLTLLPGMPAPMT